MRFNGYYGGYGGYAAPPYGYYAAPPYGYAGYGYPAGYAYPPPFDGYGYYGYADEPLDGYGYYADDVMDGYADEAMDGYDDYADEAMDGYGASDPYGYYASEDAMDGYADDAVDGYYGDDDVAGYVRPGPSPYNPGCPLPTNVAGYAEAQELDGYGPPVPVSPMVEQFTSPPPTPPTNEPETFRPLW